MAPPTRHRHVALATERFLSARIAAHRSSRNMRTSNAHRVGGVTVVATDEFALVASIKCNRQLVDTKNS